MRNSRRFGINLAEKFQNFLRVSEEQFQVFEKRKLMLVTFTYNIIIHNYCLNQIRTLWSIKGVQGRSINKASQRLLGTSVLTEYKLSETMLKLLLSHTSLGVTELHFTYHY